MRVATDHIAVTCLGFAAILALPGCNDFTGPMSKLFIEAGGGAPQTGVIGQAVPTAPTVLVTDARNHPVRGVPVTFAITGGRGSLSSTTQKTNSIGIASVVWTLGNTFGINTVTATIAGLPPVTFSATAIAPDAGVLAFNLADPAGDTLAEASTLPPGTVIPPAIDLLSLHGDFKRDSLILTATFSGPVSARVSAPNFVTGFMMFDIDDNASTGREYLLHIDGFDTRINRSTSNSPVQATYSGNTIVLRIPMSMLGNDDGNFSFAGVIGTIDRATDIFPNTGEATVRRGIGVSSTIQPSRD